MNPIIREDVDRIIRDGGKLFDSFRGSTVAVTGPYGMLASYLVFTLIRLNETDPDFRVRILALGRNEEKLKARFGPYAEAPYFRFLKTDLNGPNDIEDPVDYIIHAASFASPDAYSRDPVGVILPNTAGTLHLLELARKKKSRSLLFFSSGEIYGAVRSPLISETEGGFLDPAAVRSCYGESKRLGETLCAAYAHEYGVPAKIVRPSHTYGPTMDPEHDTRVFASFVSDALNGRDIAMTSDGTATRCFIYIADATLAYFKVLIDGVPGEAYNVTNPDGVLTIYELALLIAGLVPGKKLNVTRKAPPEGYMDRGKTAYTRLDTAKLEALGFRCRVSAKEGFARTLESFRI